MPWMKSTGVRGVVDMVGPFDQVVWSALRNVLAAAGRRIVRG
jgi:hypothetical protein